MDYLRSYVGTTTMVYRLISIRKSLTADELLGDIFKGEMTWKVM